MNRTLVEETSNNAQEAIEQVLADSIAGWNRGDLDRFMMAYDEGPETVYVSGGELTKGGSQIRAKYLRLFDSGESGAMGHLRIQVLEVRPLGCSHALLTARYELAREPQVTSGICTAVFQRAPGGWRIVCDHS